MVFFSWSYMYCVVGWPCTPVKVILDLDETLREKTLRLTARLLNWSYLNSGNLIYYMLLCGYWTISNYSVQSTCWHSIDPGYLHYMQSCNCSVRSFYTTLRTDSVIRYTNWSAQLVTSVRVYVTFVNTGVYSVISRCTLPVRSYICLNTNTGELGIIMYLSQTWRIVSFLNQHSLNFHWNSFFIYITAHTPMLFGEV